MQGQPFPELIFIKRIAPALRWLVQRQPTLKRPKTRQLDISQSASVYFGHTVRTASCVYDKNQLVRVLMALYLLSSKRRNEMSKSIFVMEDDALTVAQLQQYIEEMGYQFAGTADSAEAALVQIKQCHPDLVLMNIRLNGAMDGIDAAARLHADGEVAIIYLTAHADDEILERAKLTEPFGYLLKPFSKQDLKASVEMALFKCEMEHKQQRILDPVVQTITNMVKLHDPFLNNVQNNAATLAQAIASELKLPTAQVKGIRLAALLHALGLVAMPSELIRQLPLQGVQKIYFQTYPKITWQLLKDIEFDFPVAEMVYQHMERLDGSGFPRGLKGDAIAPGARVVALACKLAKLLTPHGRDAPTPLAQALKEIEVGSGTLFDADAVAACQRLFSEKGFSLPMA